MFGRFSWGDFIEFRSLVTLAFYSLIVYLFYLFLFPFIKTEAAVVEEPGAPEPLSLVHELVTELGLVDPPGFK